MELEQAMARVAELEGTVTTLKGERDAAVALGEQQRTTLAEAAAARDAAAAERDAAAASVAVASTAAYEAERRAILAENAGKIIPELVAGDSLDALRASVAGATAAYDRVATAARATVAAAAVPAGAGNTRAAADAAATEAMSSLEKITAGLAASKAS